MKWLKAITVSIQVCILLSGCGWSSDKQQKSSDSVPDVVTEDIQAGIEKHIEEQIRLGEGYFRVDHDGKNLKLKLVRVHTEYLANLGPRRHFACVDMAGIDGNVYDVDFFLEGDPGAMTVTETTVHKFNGQPYYVWKQRRDKTWHRAEAEGAPPELLGVLTGNDQFEFIYRAKLPRMNETARMWLPMPVTDAFQTVEVKSIDAPGRRQILRDGEYGNKVLFLTLEPADSGKTVELRYNVQRLEKGVYQEQAPQPAKFLQPERLVPDNETFRSIAEEIVEGKEGDLVRARALYDHVIDRMSYMKFGSGWGKGDAVYACNARTGNCTDFHSYFIALSRAVGIPARFAIGASIPSARNEGGIDGYHCWAEFYTEGRWWPVDISEGDKCSALSTYYFGHHPANRIELTRGRDIVVEPSPASGPINFLAYPVLEVGGKPVRVKVEFSFKRKTKKTGA
ncbi:MAG: transglutaminase-like domain-containing protein [Planctomycetota bacterium]|jgi:transglutaminase-like putative cysteine protease